MDFLTGHGFRHDLPFTSGVQYLSRHEESTARAKIIAHDEKKVEYADMEVKAKDRDVANHIRTSIQAWLAHPENQREDYLNLPGEGAGIPSTFNGFQVRLTHQIARNEFTGIETRGMGHFVQVTAPTEQEQATRRQVMIDEREHKLNNAIGFRWIFEALIGGNILNLPYDIITAGLPHVNLKDQTAEEYIISLQEKVRKRNKVLVGHNCFGDLVYLYACFIGPLPERVEDFAAEINMLCPAIVDTKHLASFTNRYGDTSLATVEQETQEYDVPQIIMPSEYDRYAHHATYHEAGFDALLTARIMIRLPAQLEREQKYINAAKDITAATAGYEGEMFGEEDAGYVTASESTEQGLGEKLVKQLEKINIFGSPSKVDAGSAVLDEEIAGMVKRGEIMPRWNAENGFWKLFGNRMQTNPAKEGIAFLK
jgi:poly(A)-specific ribonuclease